jgi:hypothetical protein
MKNQEKPNINPDYNWIDFEESKFSMEATDNVKIDDEYLQKIDNGATQGNNSCQQYIFGSGNINLGFHLGPNLANTVFPNPPFNYSLPLNWIQNWVRYDGSWFPCNSDGDIIGPSRFAPPSSPCFNNPPVLTTAQILWLSSHRSEIQVQCKSSA